MVRLYGSRKWKWHNKTALKEACLAHQESLPKLRTIHHGIDLNLYHLVEKKQQYLSFIGRIAPIKGTHIAIDVAQRAGIPLKIAGEVQPAFRESFEKKVRPPNDGRIRGIHWSGRSSGQE